MPREYYQLIKWFNEQIEPDCCPPPARKLSVVKIPKETRLSELEELLEHLSGYGKIDDYSVHWKPDGFEVCITFNSVGDAYRLSADAENMRLVWRNRALGVFNSSIETNHQPEDSDSTANGGNKNIDSNMNIYILNDDCLIQIFLRLPILDRIRLERVSKRWRTLSQASWSYVKKLYLLRSTLGLAQSESNTISTDILCTVLRRCGSRLQEIYVSDVVDDVYGNSLEYIGQFCPNVQVIHATWTNISLKSIEMLSKTCHEIRCLSLDVGVFCDFQLAKLLEASTKLYHFSGEIIMRGECLLHLPHNTIREIQLSNCRNSVLDYLTQVLPKIESLSTLSLGHRDTIILELPIAVLEALSRHRKQLKRLELMSLILPKRSIELIIEFSNLEHLDLQVTNISDEFLIRLSGKCQKLTHLNIGHCSAITWTGIAALASLPKLDKLKIKVSIIYDTPEVWRKEPLRLQRLPRSSDFPSLKHLEYGDQRILSPSELLCLIESSPLLQLVDFSWSQVDAKYGIEWIISETLARNNKVVFFVR